MREQGLPSQNVTAPIFPQLTMSANFPYAIPQIPDEELERLLETIKDYQITHGSLLKLVKSNEEHTVLSRPIGASVFPTQFPRSLFNQGVAVQPVFNELYMKVAEDEEWLEETLRDLIANDWFTRILWSIHEAVKSEGYIQPVSLGVFRSDYMIHQPGSGNVELKQVEFNSYTVAGGTHGNIVYNMHQHLLRTGAYGNFYEKALGSGTSPIPSANGTILSIVKALADAHRTYGASTNSSASCMGILMLVQPFNFNICDERPIEYGLWEQSPSIPCYRITLEEITEHISLGPSRELLYHRYPYQSSPMEVSVCYMRAGHEPREYTTDVGRAVRLVLEKSRAIKAPSLLAHLTTFKKVQQRLSMPGEVERFLNPSQAAAVRSTFMPMYPMDNSPQGHVGRALATNSKSAANHILKPSLEGGGHNIYGADIPGAINTLSEAQWKNYILMEMIKTPAQASVLISPRGLYEGPVVSELGVFGTCLWKKKEEGGAEILQNRQSGWSFKTKSTDVKEMSVVKGYGCFDSPFLVDN